MRYRNAISLLAVLALAGCGGGPTDSASSQLAEAPAESGEVVAVATTSVLGSVLDQITTCAGAESSSLMGPGDDPHTFQPSSAQIAELTTARLVVANGLGLEEGLTETLAAAVTDGATVMEIGPLVDPIPFGSHDDDDDGDDADNDDADDDGDDADDDGDDADDDGDDADDDGDDADDGDDHRHGDLDPHFWLDVSRMANAAELIGSRLAELTGDETYATCGSNVKAELQEVDAQVRAILSEIPAENRVLIVDHDAFGYFAQAYNFRVEGVVIPGGSTDAEPSSQELARLVDVVRDSGVTAIFANTANSSALVNAVAAEIGTEIAVVPLYVGTLGPAGSGAETYADMMLTNAQLVADALK